MIIKALKVASMAAVVTLSGCVSMHSQRMAPDEAPVITGSRVRHNTTPLKDAFTCLSREITALHKPAITIAVGDVKDYTGKYSQNEGSTITQGGSLMVYSALGKLGSSVNVAERFDTRIAELELAYIDRRQLGDGQKHVLNSGNGKSVVPWVPYYGGSIERSDYYIIGGITELNYNIQSGGFEFAINNSGIKARTYTMNVGADLRIVDTRTLRVIKSVSLEKQITGDEVGADTFRFFGNRLFDINLGSKNQEPLQLGVRTVLEQGVLQLVGAVTGANAPICIYDAVYTPEQRAEAAKRTGVPDRQEGLAAPATAGQGSAAAGASAGAPAPPAPPVAAPAPVAPPAQTEAVNAGEASAAPPQNAMGGRSSSQYQVPFDYGNDALGGVSAPAIEKIVAEAAAGKAVELQLIARDSEQWAPQKRQDITNARIRAVTDALVARGVQSSRISTTWSPSLSDTGITRDGSGYQIVATMAISKP